jgi:hypothetical protein
MQRIKLNVSVAGIRYSYGPGEHDVPDDIAADLVRGGHAEYIVTGDEKQRTPKSKSVSKAPRTETASAGDGETAVKE